MMRVSKQISTALLLLLLARLSIPTPSRPGLHG
jgi:hypothetical protein